MTMTRLATLCCLLALVLVAACDDDELGTDAGNCAELTYANFGKPLIDSKCVGCHAGAAPAGGVRLDTLDTIELHAAHIIEHAVDLNPPAMPYMQAPLPLADRDKLERWLECGAP
jgi:uncharacterized membrane protein